MTVSIKEYTDALRAADARLLDVLREANAKLNDEREAHRIALAASEQRAIEQSRDWVAERLSTHNNLLNKWTDATERDRSNFASVEGLEALKAAFQIYREVTAKSLALAESKNIESVALAAGKTKGFADVRSVIGFVVGLIVAGIGVYAALKGERP
jgi:hypothetical protein